MNKLVVMQTKNLIYPDKNARAVAYAKIPQSLSDDWIDFIYEKNVNNQIIKDISEIQETEIVECLKY